MKCYIWDVDGTLANVSHREHHLHKLPKDWNAWYRDADKDLPHWEIADLMIMAHNNGIANVLCTGRDEAVREQTEDWLYDHGLNYYYQKLYMRPLKDRRPDDIIKLELLEQIRADGYKPILVFEDRSRVVSMWRKQGLRCLQVAPGEF